MSLFTFDQLCEFVRTVDPCAIIDSRSMDGKIDGFSSIRCTRKNTLSWMRAQDVDWTSVQASTIICDRNCLYPKDSTTSFILTDDPRLLFAKVLANFVNNTETEGIHTTALIGRNCNIGDHVSIGAYSVIGDNVDIGDRTVIRDHVVIRNHVSIGCQCLIKSGSVIGEEGFGFAEDKDRTFVRLPHIGGVILGDHVEIGSLSTVCSGTLEPTMIGAWTKIDDHVHVAHNVVIESSCRITACVEISGSVTIGERVWIGPNSSILDCISIGDGAFIGAGANVLRSVSPMAKVIGIPAKVAGPS